MTIQENIKAVLTFRNGTELELFEDSIISASVKQQCCADGKFEIGGVYAAQLSIKCKVPGTNSFRIRGVKIQVFSKYSTEQDFISRGIFWITSAPKIGEIYSITAVDNVGWLDTDGEYYSNAQTATFSNILKYLNTALSESLLIHWALHTCEIANSLIQRMTGSSENFVVFEFTDGDSGHWRNYKYGQNLIYFTLIGANLENNSNPHDVMKYLALLSDGFVYAKPDDGKLTFELFGNAHHQIAEIYPENIEYDSLEIADYLLYIESVAVRSSQNDNKDYVESGYRTPSGYPNDVFFKITTENNPFIDGLASHYIGSGKPLGENLKCVADNLNLNPEDFSIRPFKCKVHKAERFHLGQKIQINNFESIITSIQWTFRGGYTLACGGEDSRAMTGCVQASKADKALIRCATLESRIS